MEKRPYRLVDEAAMQLVVSSNNKHSDYDRIRLQLSCSDKFLLSLRVV